MGLDLRYLSEISVSEDGGLDRTQVALVGTGRCGCCNDFSDLAPFICLLSHNYPHQTNYPSQSHYPCAKYHLVWPIILSWRNLNFSRKNECEYNQ